jgi:hypothetical protein
VKIAAAGAFVVGAAFMAVLIVVAWGLAALFSQL